MPRRLLWREAEAHGRDKKQTACKAPAQRNSMVKPPAAQHLPADGVPRKNSVDKS
jgi:hypothetical protein